MKKFYVVMVAFMLLFSSVCAKASADGSKYFNTKRLYGIDCYMVPVADSGFTVRGGDAFHLPVAIYDGYEAVFKMLAVLFNGEIGLPQDAGDEIVNIYDDVYTNDDYSSVCLYDDDMPDMLDFWNFAAWDDDEPWPKIRESLPAWAYEMKCALQEVTDFMAQMYDFVNGLSRRYDSMDDLYDYYGRSISRAISFVNEYYPGIEFYLY